MSIPTNRQSGGRRFTVKNRGQKGRGPRSGGRQSFSRSGRKGGQLTGLDISRFINQSPKVSSESGEVYQSKNSFADFDLSESLKLNLTKIGLEQPTPIQDQAIPLILAGKDVVGLANTGTGKTAAFLIPLIDKTIKDRHHQTLVLTPTRELAVQIEVEQRRLSVGQKLFSVTCIGGAGIGSQIRSLKHHNHFIIGTPGRILDLITRGNLQLGSIKAVVLDEADRMLDMGFIGDIRQILSHTPGQRSSHCFSATMPTEIERLVKDFLREPVTVSVKRQDIAGTIAQDVVHYSQLDKLDTLTSLLSQPDFSRVLVFGQMKHSVERLSRDLTKRGLKAVSIHGDKSHGQRQRALQSFKDGGSTILVATDVAARGLHINDVTHVINYDLPSTYEDYIHRIGRTGRANGYGQALTFVEKNK